MIAKDNESQFAIFVDYENVADQEGKHLDRIVREVSVEGSIAMLRAYADWSRFGNHRKRLQAKGFELIDLPSTNGKNRADMKLVVDVLEAAFTKNFIDSYIIVSGDSDFVPLVTKLNELNRRAWLYTVQDVHSPILAQYCYRIGSCVAQPTKPVPSVKTKPASSASIAGVRLTTSASQRQTATVSMGLASANSFVSTKQKTKSAVSKDVLRAKTEEMPVTKPLVSDELLERVYWVMRAMDHVQPGPHRLQHLSTNLRALNPTIDLRVIMAATKRCTIRFAEQLQSRGFIKIEYREIECAHYVSLSAKGQAKYSGAQPPEWFEQICQRHRDRFRSPVFAPTVPKANLVASQEIARQEVLRHETVSINASTGGRRMAYQLSLFEEL